MGDLFDSPPISLTPIKLSESISTLSFQVVWPGGYVDLTKSILSKDELERLLIHLKRNIKIGSILFHEEQDRFDYTFCKIIKRLRKNNEIFNYHPSDYMCGVLAGHIYCEPSIFKSKKSVDFRDIIAINSPKATASQLESINEYLSQLEIIHFLNEDGFQYAVYENKEMHHLIMAFRGTVPTNIREAAFTVFEDVVGITLKDKNSFQQRMVFKVVKEAVEICKAKHYNLTIVGHSLGAWLSELAHYDCFYNHNFKHVKTVTFDSPGALDQFKVIDNYKEPSIPYHCMNIVSYLSEPNIVNSMNNHIFDNDTTFRIYPSGVDEVDCMKLDFLISSKFHKLGVILDTFDFETGKPRHYKIVKKWPLIKLSQLSLYFSYFEKNDNGALENPNNPDEDNVLYDVEVVNPYSGMLVLDRFKIDEIIHQLSIKNYFYEFSDYFISTQLKELKSLFEISKENSESLYQISVKNNMITCETLKQRISRIVNLNPKEISKVLKSNDQDYIPRDYKIRVTHSNSEGFFDPDNYLDKIEKILTNNNMIILTGEEGSGKSTIALEYALNKFPTSNNHNNPLTNQPFKNHKLLYIHSNTKEMIYEDFSNHLLKNYQKDHNGPEECGTTYDFQLSPNNLIDFYKVIMDSQDTCFMFVFDNVQDLTIIEPFLFYMPKLNTRTIITCQVEKGRTFYIERTLSLTKQSTNDIVLNVTLLTNQQANNYLLTRGINSNCNLDSPVSIHLLNILVNHFNKEESETGDTIDFDKTLSNVIKEFIKINPNSNQLLNTLAYLDPESISYQVISKIQQNDDTESTQQMESIQQSIKYWSDLSVINNFSSAEKVNTYKYIQQLIRNEIISGAEKEETIHRIKTVLSNLDLTSSQHPKGWRIYFNHLRYLYDNFKEICTIKMIENMAICYRLSSSYQESIKFLNESLEVKKNSTHSNQDLKNDISNTLFQLGFTYQKNEEFTNAIYFYNLVLQNSNQQEMISKTYNQIGLCNFKLGNIDESLIWYEKSLSIEKSNEALASIHLNLGDYYSSKNNDIKNAKNQYLMALNLIETESNEISPISVKSNFKLSMIDYLEGNFKVAIENFEKTIKLYKELYKSSHHADIATCFEKIGLSYLKDADILINPTVLLNSLKNLQESLNIRLKIHRTNLTHKDIGESYYNLGVCYKKRLENRESFNCFLKSYNIQKSNGDNLLQILECLSTASYLSKDYQTSIDYSNKIIKILEDDGGDKNPINTMKLAIAYKNIGENYKLLKLNQESISNLQKSLTILENQISKTKINFNDFKQSIEKTNSNNNNNDSLVSLLKTIEIIGSIYFNLNQMENSKNKHYKTKLEYYFNVLKTFQSISPENYEFLDNSEWFVEYKKSKSSFPLNKIIIFSSILIILISLYYHNQTSK
ncbi:hypothetical protein DDB_G0281671 [Dictyostelium discoideum AX4]|uniref:Fungal lipase-type domain-containing protein n=1 Tax=Dictyostelium discoideum TaxID=44689 RepID=Q54TM1_DICDI|nr:hypothetical protein DDB_G0281671 [Dictyostelium discoideum AX4]EAL66597.1 hypothetical protein DDB_G0281671 [Dictyostelium discoideum AX4]|eukprot:XP_640570.1 hypothetical protein DDB_G0281671 [Dictyostelium discoideum AX4]